MAVIKKILFASDFTTITDRAEAYVKAIAAPVGAVVTVIHSVEPIDGAADDEHVAKFLATLEEEARKKGQVVVDRFKADGIDCELLVNAGKRWKAIVDTAATGEFDLVVLGAHKVTDGEKVYLGTTTHKVFFASDVPLLVVPTA